MGEIERVVAVAGQDERGHRLDLACQQSQHVERRLVGPVQVLDDEHGRARAGELADERRGHLVRPSLARHELLELAAGDLGEVEERAERARGEQALAGSAQDPRRRGQALAERLQEDRLAGSGLAADEHEPAGLAGDHRVERLGQCGQLPAALEQLAGGVQGPARGLTAR